MGSVGEVYADAGLHIDEGSFAAYAAELNSAEGKISDFADAGKTLMAGMFAGVAVGVGAAALEGVSLASGFQDVGVSLTNLYGSADIAREKFNWMKDFAAQTPFEFGDVEEAAIKLKSYGMDIEDYGRTMGDVAANMGKNINDVVEAYADAGQGEFERLKEFGVKAVQVQKSNLDQYAAYGASVGDTVLTYTDKNMQQCAQVVDRNNSQMVYSTLNNIFDIEKGFQGAMETRSKTLSGMMSTLKDNLTFGLAEIVGYDMETMSVKTASLMGVLMGLVDVAGKVTGAFANMPQPLQNFVAIAALGVVTVSLLAAGFVAYNAVVGLGIGSTALFGTTLSAAIWPVTAVVLGLAALGAGLTYLDEKTGIVTNSWNLLKDIFTIVVDGIMTAAGTLRDFIGGICDQIQTYLSNMIPAGWVETLSGIFNNISGKFGNMASSYHEKAQNIRQSNNDIASSTEAPKSALDGLKTKFLGSGSAADSAGTSYKGAGSAAKGAQAGFNAATSGLNGTTSAANSTKSALNSVTQAALNSAKAIREVWAAQQQIAKTNITIAEANKSVGKSYGTSPNGLGSYNAKDGVRVIAATSSDGTTANARYNQEVQALNQAGVHVNVAQINNYGESTSATKTTMAVHGA